MTVLLELILESLENVFVNKSAQVRHRLGDHVNYERQSVIESTQSQNDSIVHRVDLVTVAGDGGGEELVRQKVFHTHREDRRHVETRDR